MTLKILVVAENNSWMNPHIVNSMEAMGHRVNRFYYGDYVGEFYGHARRHEQIAKNKMLVNLAKSLQDENGLDLIFCYVYDDFLMPQYAKALSDLHIPMVNYNVDMPGQWFRQTRTASYFDLMLCAQLDHIMDLKKYSKKVLYFPMAALSKSPNSSNNIEKINNIAFLGTATPYRRYVFSHLAKQLHDFSIYGKYWNELQSDAIIRHISRTFKDIRYYGWPRYRAEGVSRLWKIFLERLSIRKNKILDDYIPSQLLKGKLSDDDLLTVFQRSKINIGVTRCENDNPHQIGRCQMKLRDFEVPMAGGFYLVEKAPGYDQLFVDGKEVVTWQTLDELSEKIDYYLKHDDEREAIALAGQKRAMRDHTWEARFNTLFLELGLIK